MLNPMTFTLPEGIESEVRVEARSWNTDEIVPRIWLKDSSVWTGEDESRWLGWLDIVGDELNDLEKYYDLRKDIESAGFTEVLLMGMGGSSLCPEVLAITFDKPYFHILDSTVPAAVKAMENRLDISRTLFIVASKSGSTLEPNCFKQYFFEKVAEIAGRENAGKQFIAITDPGSKMEQIAKDDGFRHIFYGKPEIGGRFSALSAFGLAAAAAMDIDVKRLLENASVMVDACKVKDPINNPGALLGLILGVCHRNGRDKLTILTSPEIYDLGAWLEQLIAESTGKNGVAIIPVDQEPLLPVEDYGDDRVFVYLKVKGGSDHEIDELQNSGHPFVTIELNDIYQLGQEFFRWEFATAVAGAVMGINPFNQPDVESAKIEARKITEKYEQTGSLPEEKPFYEEDGIKLFTSPEYCAELDTIFEGKTLADFLEAHVSMLDWKDYFALLAYVEMNGENEDLLQAIRARVLEIEGTATCLGFGPRFLHSTGQAYKGGGSNGVFLQITSDDEFDLPVPGQKYTFGVVKAAQARGDFQVLLDRGRRALRVHIGPDVQAGLKKILRMIEQI